MRLLPAVLVARRVVLPVAVVVTLVTACGQAAAPTPTPIPVATSADEFAAAWCSSLKSMVRAIGNPDTGDDSELSAALDAAIERGDAAEVQRLAAAMSAELATGRKFAAVAAGWEPGSAAAVAVDQLLLAFGAMVDAKRAAADEGRAAAEERGQSALEQAGGLAAWQSMLETARAVPPDAMQQLEDCRPWDEAGSIP
jgi:hypothetical protein